MKLIQETKFLKDRQRGAGTLPCTIQNNYPLYEIDTFHKHLFQEDKPFVWFYRDITAMLKSTSIKALYNTKDNGTLYYSRSLQELNLNAPSLSKYKVIENQIVGNGFYYCKYYNQRYLPTYFSRNFKYSEKFPIKYKYGIYLRDEYLEDQAQLDKFLKETGTNPKDILIFGKPGMLSPRNCTFSQDYFFNSIETYLVVSAKNDSVPNTLVEVFRNKIPILLLNDLQPASGTKEILEGNSYYQERFFEVLDKVNALAWSEGPTKNLDKINEYFQKSKTFLDFLKLVDKD